MAEPYKIVGLGAVQPRLEIRDLQNNTEQFALFIHALYTIMQPEYRPKAARFQDLAGIHGLPYERWAGDPDAPDANPEGTWGGYCNHGSVLFPTWHRPYVLGVEQSVSESAIRLAQRWTKHVDDDTKQLWMNAAYTLRFPFWDWTDLSAKVDGLPDVLKPQTFIFTLPDGTQSDPIDNPLAHYEFGSNIPDGFQDMIWNTPLAPTNGVSFFKKWSRTYRWPSGKLNPIENYVKIDQLLAGDASQRGSCDQLRAQVSKLFTCYSPYSGLVADGQESFIWDEFSNTTFQSKDKTSWQPQGIGSIESPHNSVHLLLGGLGAMANNDYAGFDPIFYLHHCNVDRILAFWEYTYHTYWVGTGYEDKDGNIVPFTQDDGTWDEGDDAAIDESSDLQPFRQANSNYWNSLDTRFLNDQQIFPKGYTYPDIVATVNDQTITVSLTAEFPDTEDEVENCMAALQAHFGQSQPNAQLGLVLGPAPPGHEAIPDYRRFSVVLELIGHAFGGSYSLQIVYKNTVVTSFAVLSRGDNTQCAACKIHARAGGKVRGIVDLPDDVIYDISSTISHSGGSKLNSIISALKLSFSVRLVGPGGSLLADAVPSHEGSQFTRGQSQGAPLDQSIVPRLELRSAAAMKRRVRNRRSQAPLKFFDHQGHDTLLSNHQWRTA